jgi:ABC-type multidrug transport system fused ATPase/permease subunit
MNDPQYMSEALSELRDNALLLFLANKYLCEEQYLVKIGRSIDENAQQLKKDIISLKNEFPGKFVSEENTDEIIEGILGKAQLMQKPGNKIQEKCVLGELGHELEDAINSVSDAINRIKRKVEGKDVTYTPKDSMSSLFSGITNLGTLMGRGFSISIKILFVLLLIAIFTFGYLYVTMEKIGDIRKEVDNTRALIQSKRDLLSQLEGKKKQLEEKKRSFGNRDLALKERIELMDLDVEIHKINEERQQVVAEIEDQEHGVADNQKKIDEMEKKSFLKRLLRQ